VGKSNNPERRRKQHIREALAKGKDERKSRWICEMLEEGFEPEVEVLLDVPMDSWRETEQETMDEYEGAGFYLLNCAPGGGGPPDWNEIIQKSWDENPERKAMLARRSRKMWADPEMRERLVQQMEDYWADPENRERMSNAQKRTWEESPPERRDAISERNNANWADPEYRERMIEINQEIWSDPERLEEHAERTRQLWEDPEYRQRVIEATTAPDVQARRKAALDAYWADEQNRQARSEKMQELHQDPEYRASWEAGMEQVRPQIAKSLIEYWDDEERRRQASEAATQRMAERPEIRHKISETVKALHQDPEFKAKLAAAEPQRVENIKAALAEYFSTDEAHQKASETATRRWQDPEYRAKQAEALRKRHEREKAEWQPSDVEKAANALGVTIRTAYKYCQKGLLGRKVGGQWVVTPEDVTAFQAGPHPSPPGTRELVS